MDNNNNIGTLVKHLEQEIQWIEQLNHILAEEKLILVTRQFDKLEDMAHQKQELSDKLEESANQRDQFINNAVGSMPKKTIKDFLMQCNVAEGLQLNELNNKLAEQLATCRELNSVNGQVIANNIYTRQEIVKALSENKTDAVSIYTAHGNMETTNTHAKHHEEA